MEVPGDRDPIDVEAVGKYLDDLIANYRVVGSEGSGARLERRD